jgi:hypothetical protein
MLVEKLQAAGLGVFYHQELARFLGGSELINQGELIKIKRDLYMLSFYRSHAGQRNACL